MSRTLRIFQVDAFTSARGGGNPAVVALDAQQLDGTEMQRLARERHDGDWAFALPPSVAHADLDVRFFSPRRELPFVGHATLALHAVLEHFERRTGRRQHGATGIVEVQNLPDGWFRIWQPAPPLGRLLEAGELDEVLALLGAARTRLDPRCPPRIAGGASTRLLIGLADTAALDALTPRLAELAALSARLGAQGYFPFVAGHDAAGHLFTESRMFCPAIGIDEDPVSGNAHAMLGVYLREYGLLPIKNDAGEDGADGSRTGFVGLQGRHVGRPGAITVTVQLDTGGKPDTTAIGGHAVIASATTLTLA